MKLTIGMASFNNYAEVWFTVQAIRMYHDLSDTEILVIDNFGDDRLRDFITSWGTGQVRYIRDTTIQGTAYPRQMIYDQALGEWVMVIDSHVLLAPNTISRFKKWAAAHPHCMDLLHGPMLYDDLINMADSMKDEWAGNMWGVWNLGHVEDEIETYDIPMHGMGFSICRKDAWLGYNPEFKGFGGEEGYIHQKFRNAGRRVICLPWMKWSHKFNTIGGVCDAPYSPQLSDIINNYKIGFAEVGLDTEPLFRHFNIAKPVHAISNIQIDTNAHCGSKCWYCPVSYIPRPDGCIMDQLLFDKILDDIIRGKESGAVKHDCLIWLSSYNDILLDPNLINRLQSMRIRGLRFACLTNGIGIGNVAELVNSYKDVIGGWSINLPAGDRDTYSRYTGNPPGVFDTIIAGIHKLVSTDPEYYQRVLNICCNGMHDQDIPITKFFLRPGENDLQVINLKEIFPTLNITAARSMCDRAGLLSHYALDNKMNRPVTQCNNGGDRPTDWIHVNSKGLTYLCCCDYEEKSITGDLNIQALHDIVTSDKSEADLEVRTRLCSHCIFAN